MFALLLRTNNPLRSADLSNLLCQQQLCKIQSCRRDRALFDCSVVARWLEVKNKEFYYITTMADNEKSSADTTLACFRGFADCVEGAVEKGTVVAGGVYEKGEIKNHPAMKFAYQMGKNV